MTPLAKNGWTLFSHLQRWVVKIIFLVGDVVGWLQLLVVAYSHVSLGRSGKDIGGESGGSRGCQTRREVDELLDDHHHHIDLHQLQCHQHLCLRNLLAHKFAL